MSNLNPTVVIAHLEDKELKESIANLVAHVKRGMHTMITDTNSTIDAMEKKIKSLGDIKIDSIGTINGGFAKSKSSRSVKGQTEEVKAVKESIQAYKEKVVALDQVAEAQQKAARGLTDKSRRYQDDILRTDFNKLLKMPEENLEQMQRKVEAITTRLTTLRDIGVLTPNKIQMADQMVARLQQEASTIQRTNNLEQQRASLEQRIATLTEQRTAIGKSGYQAQENLKALSAQLKTQEEQRANVAQRIKDIETQTADAEQRKNNAQQLWIQTGNEVVSQKQKLRELNSEIQRQEEKIAQQRKEGGILTSIERTTGGLARVARSMGGGELSGIVAEEEKLNNLKKERAALEAKIAQLQERTQDATKKTHVAAEAALKTRKDNEQTLLSLNSQLDRIDKSIAETKRKQAEESAKKKAMEQSYLSISEQINSVEQKLESTTNRQVEKKSAELQTEKQITQEKEKQEQITRQGKEYKAPTTSPSFEKMVANTLGLKASDIETDAQRIQRLNVYLNQLQQTWDRLTPTMQNSNFGRMLKEEFQSTSRYVQQLRKDLSIPINLDAALKGPEKTLDDIAYKIQRLQSYKRGRIDLTDPKQVAEIKTIDAEINRLNTDLNKYMGTTKKASELNNALTRSWNYMKNRLAFYFTVGASTQFVKNLIEVRSQYELLERSIGILIDSAQNGSQIFAELNSMAIKSPFTTMELGAAAKQLVAYDVAAKDVVDTTRRLADMAAAVGIPIERLTYALGQIKSYGYLNSRDARMFSNAGIPLVKQLADYYTELEGRMVSVGDVYDRIKKKTIDYNDVMSVMYKMTDEGGKFFNFQEKAADTLKVRLANLTLAWNNMMNDIGKDTQGFLVGSLNALKQIFEHWRSINNWIGSALVSLGLFKTLQFTILTLTSKQLTLTKLLAITQQTFGKKMAEVVKSLATMSINPASIGVAALTALSVWLTKVTLDYIDLQKANEQFNQSIIDGANENIASIDKFFDDYKRQFDSLGSLNEADTNKLWERLQEEIEKTTKNAGDYLDVLEKIDDKSQRISAGTALLEQTQEIEKELKRLAELGTFDVGGGFADDALADNIEETTKYANKLITSYGTLYEAEEKLGKSSYANTWSNYKTSLTETKKELDDFIAKLDNVDIQRVMGEDPTTQLANIRAVASIYRDNFLATEKGQKITANGQAIINDALDKWIAKQAQANNLINERIINNRKYSVEEVRNIEENRTAWTIFFDQLKSEDKSRLDYLIKTNQTGSKEFQEIWDKATEKMAKNATTSYDLIQEQIARLRETPDIVINVVYKETKDSLNERQRAYVDRYIEVGEGALSADEYEKIRKANNEKFGRFMIKADEDDVEWEKRLGQEYQNNANKIQSLNSQLSNSAKLSDIDRNAKQKQLDTLIEQQKVLDQLKSDENFNFEQFEKGGKKAGSSKKDELGEALSKEVQYINDIQKRFKEYKQAGVDAQEALTLATNEYGKSIVRNNAILQKFGIKTLSSSQLASMPIQEIRDFYKEQLSGASASAKGVEALEKAIANLNTEITKIDYKRITDGLNNELSKIKDEYELAVELDANPELGNIFTDIFDIDTNELPRNLDEYAEKVTDALNKSFEKQKKDFRLPTIELTDDDLKAYKEESQKPTGLITEADYNEIEKQTKDIRNLRKKDREDTLKKTQELQYKLGDINEKIAIETKKLTNLQIQAEKEKNAEKKALLDLEIQQQQEVINKLGEDVLQMLPTYKNLFNSIAEHSAVVTRRIAKQWKDALENATRNADGSYTITDPTNGKKATISEKQYGKELDRVNGKLRETQAAFAKIKEALTKGDDATLDWAKGLELIAEEARKAADGVRTVAEIFDALGGDEDTTEILNDVATSMEGISTAGQGVSQIASGDYIGGTVNVIKGAWQAISTWFDNDNKKIDRQIEKSKFKVQELELAYKKLGYAAKKALGTEETVAKRESIAVKEQELAELERQLALEQQKDYKKDSDEREQKERIQDYLDSIESLKQEIQDAKEEIVNNLLGGDVKSAAEEFVDTWVEAWRAGETTLDAIEEKMDEMIFNLIKKAMTSKIVEKLLNPFYKEVNRMTSAESEGGEELTTNELRQLAQMAGVTAEKINTALGEFYGNLDALDIISQSSEANKQLSALQQGLQSMSESTANALEAYANSINQQAYLRNDMLVQIRDTIMSFDMDVQLGVFSQMLLQLQSNYIVMQSMQSMMDGWTIPSGQGIRVELLS